MQERVCAKWAIKADGCLAASGDREARESRRAAAGKPCGSLQRRPPVSPGEPMALCKKQAHFSVCKKTAAVVSSLNMFSESFGSRKPS